MHPLTYGLPFHPDLPLFACLILMSPFFAELEIHSCFGHKPLQTIPTNPIILMISLAPLVSSPFLFGQRTKTIHLHLFKDNVLLLRISHLVSKAWFADAAFSKKFTQCLLFPPPPHCLGWFSYNSYSPKIKPGGGFAVGTPGAPQRQSPLCWYSLRGPTIWVDAQLKTLGWRCLSHGQVLLCIRDGCCCITNLNLQFILLPSITLALSNQTNRVNNRWFKQSIMN